MSDFSAADLRNLHACVEQSYKNIGSSDDAKVLIILQQKIEKQLEATNSPQLDAFEEVEPDSEDA